jgi:hypothetical protein
MRMAGRLRARRVLRPGSGPATAEALLALQPSSARADAAEGLVATPRRAARVLPGALRAERHVLVLACLLEAARHPAVVPRCRLEVARALHDLAEAAPSGLVRSRAVTSLAAHSGGPGWAAWLRHRLAIDRSGHARVALAAELAALGDGAGRRELARLARSRRATVARRARHALSGLRC